MTVEVSAIVVTYRHADFIGAAIRSVLAQTGPAYEIVVSDDCSGDGTLDAARDALRETPPGIRVAIASTAGNAGLGANLNNAVAQSTGRILVACSGDDVSMPGRFAKLVEAFGAPGDGVYAVTSDAQKIDAAGRPTGVEPGWRQPGPIVAEAFATPDVSTCGAATAYRREVFDVFGPLEPGVNWEDQVLPFLAALLGKVAWLREPLVGYRFHGANMTTPFDVHSNSPERFAASVLATASAQIRVLGQKLKDVETLGRARPDTARDLDRLRLALERAIRLQRLTLLLAERPARAVALLLAGAASGAYRPGLVLKQIAMVRFPAWWLRRIRDAYVKRP